MLLLLLQRRYHWFHCGARRSSLPRPINLWVDCSQTNSSVLVSCSCCGSRPRGSAAGHKVLLLPMMLARESTSCVSSCWCFVFCQQQRLHSELSLSTRSCCCCSRCCHCCLYWAYVAMMCTHSSFFLLEISVVAYGLFRSSGDSR